MPLLSSTYLIPAILLNPAFVLHCINTFVSHWVPHPPTTSGSPHPFMESIGPAPGSKPYMDIHADDALCWRYTAVMVFVQILAFGRVSDNRVRRKSAKAAKIEREKARKERLAQLEDEMKQRQKTKERTGGLDGIFELLEEYDSGYCIANGNGHAHIKEGTDSSEESITGGSMTDTSEELPVI